MRILSCSLVLLFVLTPIAVLAGEEADDGVRRDARLRGLLEEITAVRSADSIVLATMARVHESPGVWCGYLMTHQDVTYRIAETLFGKAASGEVTVEHLLIHGSGTCCRDEPFLRPDRFHPGARAVLLLSRVEGKWVVKDEGYGVRLVDPPIEPSADVRDLCRLTLDLPELQSYLHPDVAGRVPVVVELSPAMPLPVQMEKFGKEVVFVPKELVRGRPRIYFGAIRVEGDGAVVEFGYSGEALAGHVECKKGAEGWTVTGSSLVEK